MADVDISLEVEAKKAKKELNKINKELKDTGKNAKKTSKAVSKSFDISAGAIAGATAAVAALGAGFSFAIGEAIKIEDLETSFIAFTGSAESAAEQIERIAEFSASTPFQLEELSKANRTLLAFGSSTEESLVQLKQLGEAAAATGSDIGELATIFGQIQAETKLSSERFNQLIERGINIGPALAESLGVAESQLKDLRAQGKISADEVAKAFEKMTTGSGIFAGSTKRLSETLSGSFSTLEDNVSLLAAAIGKKLSPVLIDVTVELTRLAKGFTSFIEDSKPDQLRQLNGELKVLKNDLKAFKNVEGVFDFFFGVDESAEKVSQLTQQIKALENQIVNISTGTLIGPQLPEDRSAKVAEENAKIIAETEKFNNELLTLSQQAAANRALVESAKSEEELAILDERFEKIQTKIAEQQALRLESIGSVEEAERLRVEEQLRSIQAIKDKAFEEAKKSGEKAKKDELNLEKIAAEESLKFQQKTNLEKAKAVKDGLGNIAGLQRTGVKEFFAIGKAAALAQAAIAIPETALQAYKSGVGIGGPPLGAVFAAAATATQLANLSRIQSAKFTGFSEGGLVEGGIAGQDSVPALLTPGEVVVPQKNYNDIKVENSENVIELRRLNRNIEQQNEVLFNISANTNETAIGTQQVAVGIANIQLPGVNNPGAGANYTEWNIEQYAEAGRILAQQEAERQSQEFANESIGSTTSGQANIQIGG